MAVRDLRNTTSVVRRQARQFVFGTITLALSAGLAWAQDAQVEKGDPGVKRESLEHWAYFVPVMIPEDIKSPWVDCVLTPAVFDQARHDLRDLRVYGGQGTEIPFALRVLREKSEKAPRKGRLFNRTELPNRVTEVSIDLGEQPGEHNEIQLTLPGTNYRRRVELEGSDDGRQWRPIRKGYVAFFRRGREQWKEDSVAYDPVRYRYLRVRVVPDPEVDEKPVSIEEAQVYRSVAIPGERLTLDGQLGPRQPVRTNGQPASAWVVTLGGNHTPVDRVEVDVDDAEFARDYVIKAGGPLDSDEKFRVVGGGVWRRRAGEKVSPMVATFSEARAARLRIEVVDHRNPPLRIRAVRYSAPARQVVFAAKDVTGPRLYFGNPDAEATQYDFARNLPEKLDPPPARATLGTRQDNPVFTPKPLPLSERWPWLVYVVLSMVIVVLGGVLLSISHVAIRSDDQAAVEAGQRDGRG